MSPPPYDSCNLGTGVGDSRQNVQANRAAVAAKLGVRHIVFLRQVHGADVVVADGPWRGARPAADGVVTTVPGLAIAVLGADCAPVLLADADAGVVAAAHVGRSGLAKAVAPDTVARMRELGARPQRIVAVIGPSVCSACYEVPGELQAAVAAKVPAALARSRKGAPALDIAAGVTAQLRAVGVRTVTRSAECTMESPHLYSYRRDGTTGRSAGIVWIDSPS